MAHHVDHRTRRPPPIAEPPAPRSAPELVPSRRQYLDLKAAHPDAILLYRLGDFYETFDDDAALVARAARITLTSRSFGRSGRVPMAGIPHHALNHYLGRLLAAGHAVAIAEQVGPTGRGLVERAVTRVLTPGTVAEPALLAASESRYLAAVHRLRGRCGLAWLDASTGEFALLEVDGDDAPDRLGEELARLAPAECLVPDHFVDEDDTDRPLPVGGAHRTRLERWHFEPARAESALCRRFAVRSLHAYGCADLPAAVGAAGAILAYVERTNPALLTLLTGLRTESVDRSVGLDAATRRNLELTRSLGTGGSRGSLLGVVDRTRTPMGARALRRLLGRPLRDLSELRRRHALVTALVAEAPARALLGGQLASTGDLERLLGRVAHGQAGPRDYLAIADALRSVPVIEQLLARLQGASPPPAAIPTATDAAPGSGLDPCAEVLAFIERGVDTDDADLGRIRPGFWPDLDAAHADAHETRCWLSSLEARERERTGIRSLKVGYTRVFGYYIEVTRPNLGHIPKEYRRKQTVAVGERFITTPLKEAEARLLAADEEIAGHERAALDQLRSGVLAHTRRLQATASSLAALDALLALADAAAQHDWVAPELDDGDGLLIEGGRHPVVEVGLAGEAFIPNDCLLGGGGPRQLVVTGPNMGGKSTFLRQTALIVLLAQVGSFVPAERAKIGLVDRIFTRVGAQDDLARGQSTFMVEMVETAAILHQATRRSLLILDEVGRGTGTDDGLAIARAVLEDINGRIAARALFATHYLELTALAAEQPAIANAHVAALEHDGRVLFLYAVRPGPADRAYGIHVARLAGLPPWVADRAETILGGLREDRSRDSAETATPPAPLPPASSPASVLDALPAARHAAETSPPYQLDLDGRPAATVAGPRLANALLDLDLSALTPRQALDWLHEQRSRLGGR